MPACTSDPSCTSDTGGGSVAMSAAMGFFDGMVVGEMLNHGKDDGAVGISTDTGEVIHSM